jgi:integrase
MHAQLRDDVEAYLAERHAKGTDGLDAPLFWGRKTRPGGKGMNRSTLWREFDRIATTAGVEGNVGLMSLYKVYTLRIYQESRWNVRYVQQNLGHSEIHTTFALLGQIAEECQQQDIPLFPNDGLS